MMRCTLLYVKIWRNVFTTQKYHYTPCPIIKSAKNICRNCCFFDLKLVKK